MSSLIWIPQGSRPATDGQVEGVQGGEVVGAINAVAPHPTDSNTLYAGSVNGGIWRSNDAMAQRPSWQNLTNDFKSLSIGDVSFDTADASFMTLVAGTGRFSSMSGSGGALLGVLITTDGGNTWTIRDNNRVFQSFHIRSVVAHHGAIVVAADSKRSRASDGLYRSPDSGVTWQHLSGTALFAGVSYCVVADRQDPTRLYAHAGTGIFRSDNSGLNWTKISNFQIDRLLGNRASNVLVASGPGNTVYAAIALFGRLSGLFRSDNAGGSWSALDLPSTVENGGHSFGIHPGGQAGIHFSLTADPVNESVVYVGGDRQPFADEGKPGHEQSEDFPNSLGAMDYSGRLFKVDASRPSGTQATPITHSGTTSKSSPHADSRGMAFAANGDLIECDDGGIYRRTQPSSNTGDWLSMNGDLQNSEFHSAAWDENTKTVIAGAQDTGSQQQDRQGAARWPSISTGDGGVVAVDALTPGISVRYSSYQRLLQARREEYDANGVRQSAARLRLAVIGPPNSVSPRFYTPIVANRAVSGRLIIAATNGIFESFDQGDTLTWLMHATRNLSAAAIAYGSDTNSDILYVGAGASVFVRQAAAPSPMAPTARLSGSGDVTGIAIDPANPTTAFATFRDRVNMTRNAGASWTGITRNLRTVGARMIRCVAYCHNIGPGKLVVGTNTGAYVATAPNFATWKKLGADLPSAPIMQMQYSQADRLLLAGTLGRGAWTLVFPDPAIA